MASSQIPPNLTSQEVELHQDFFVQSAKDYRSLAEKLIRQLAIHLKQPLIEELPLITLNPNGDRGYGQTGEMNDWKYGFHGFHCNFTHNNTYQEIEVPLTFGMEFGILDPYFFSRYINSTPEYQPLPFKIKDAYAEGRVILKKMLELGLYEKVSASIHEQLGVVVVDREKIAIKVLTYEEHHHLVSLYSI